MIWIGIDTGKHTGFAVWDDSKGMLLSVETLLIHQAMDKVLELSKGNEVLVVFEDARQRSDSSFVSRAKAQGAGSVKRDATIWQDFLADHHIPFNAVRPMRGATKLTESYFKMLTKWNGRTSNHARDAAMLVFGR